MPKVTTANSAKVTVTIKWIRHYYILENSVQTMYRCYDKLSKEAFHEVPKKEKDKYRSPKNRIDSCDMKKGENK